MGPIPRAAALAFALSLVSPPALAQRGPDAAAAEEAAAPEQPAPRRRATVRAEREDVRPFFEEHLPDPLLRRGPRGLLWWQWLAAPVLVAGAALGWATRRVLGHLAARTETRWDDLLLERLTRPFTAFWAIAVFTAFHAW